MKVILPGATIGILGGGQLGRMMALEGRRMGYRIAVLDPDPDGPTGQIADLSIPGSFRDADAARELAGASDVITLDTEHIPAEVISGIEKLRPVRPGAAIMAVIQDRLSQRRFLADNGIPQPRHAPVGSLADLQSAVQDLGFPCILKTRRWGYDGKGQARLNGPADCASAWQATGQQPAVLEAFVEFRGEISAVLARNQAGEVRVYPIAENDHVNHILHTTIAPARISTATATAAAETGTKIAAALDYVGVMAVELFELRNGSVLVNEIAPRTHNSGHYTFGACVTSQFAQHLRAICGLPLGESTLLRPAVMINLLGDAWAGGTPDWPAVLRHPGVALHLYGKAKILPGRKMGHILVSHDSQERALEISGEIQESLGISPAPASAGPRAGGRVAGG